MDTRTGANIRGADTLFSKEAIRAALGPEAEERPDEELGEPYDVLSTETVSVTTHFSAFGWYHISNVTADEQMEEDGFWNRLEDIVANNPRVMAGT